MLSAEWPLFFREHWGQQPGVFDLEPAPEITIGRETVFDLFAAHSQYDGDFTTFESPGPAGRDLISECWSGTPRPSPAAFEAIAGRAVLMIRGIQRFVPSVREYLRGWEQLFALRVNANLYLSQSGIAGFKPHADTHHVFALQLEGEKEWRLWEPVYDAALRGFSLPSLSERLQAHEPEHCLTRPGQCIYLPLGWPHDASTSSAYSLHLTVGINPPRWLDVIQEEFRHVAAKASILRRAIPLHFECGRIQWVAQRKDVIDLVAFAQQCLLESDEDRAIVWPRPE